MVVNWHTVEERVYQWCLDGITQFAERHPGTACSFLAISYNTDAGLFQFSLDTPDNALREAQANERDAIERRRRMLAPEWGWRAATYFATDPRVVDYTPHPGAFAYQVGPVLELEALRHLQSQEGYPERNEHEDDYTQGNAVVVIWRVVERLVDAGAFAALCTAAPFRIGYLIDDEELVVLRILNWPMPPT